MISISRYKSRKGKRMMVASRRRALDELWPEYGIEGGDSLDLDILFGRRAPSRLEIGIGMGDALLEMSAAHPENNYLGIDVYPPGIGRALMGIHDAALKNVRLARGDAMELLDRLPDASLDRVYLFFPDPWPKKRHHKRRLVQAPFIEKLHRVIAPGGLFHAATDWEDYALQIDRVMAAADGFEACRQGQIDRPRTKFEMRGLRRGREIRDLLFERI